MAGNTRQRNGKGDSIPICGKFGSRFTVITPRRREQRAGERGGERERVSERALSPSSPAPALHALALPLALSAVGVEIDFVHNFRSHSQLKVWFAGIKGSMPRKDETRQYRAKPS